MTIALESMHTVEHVVEAEDILTVFCEDPAASEDILTVEMKDGKRLYYDCLVFNHIEEG